MLFSNRRNLHEKLTAVSYGMDLMGSIVGILAADHFRFIWKKEPAKLIVPLETRLTLEDDLFNNCYLSASCLLLPQRLDYAIGRENVNAAPSLPGLFSPHIVPPWASTIALEMYSPKPVPPKSEDDANF